MKKPNFFIIGAPKCGTTALSEYLRGHSNVFMSWPKEPHYFAEDFDQYRRIKTYDDYIDIFSPANDHYLAVGEASVWYLYSSSAIKNIYKFNNKAKIIVMLRNPVDFVQSLHSELVATFFEDEKIFKTAWELQSARKKGKDILTTCSEKSFLQYKKAGSFGEQLERVFKVFPKDRIKVLLLDDFANTTREVYEDTLSFLGIPSDGRMEFPKINVRRETQIEWLGKILYHPPFPLNWLEKKSKEILKIVGIREFKLWHKIINMNAKKISHKNLLPEFRKELVDEFRVDIEKLSGIIGKDLSFWLLPPEEIKKIKK